MFATGTTFFNLSVLTPILLSWYNNTLFINYIQHIRLSNFKTISHPLTHLYTLQSLAKSCEWTLPYRVKLWMCRGSWKSSPTNLNAVNSVGCLYKIFSKLSTHWNRMTHICVREPSHHCSEQWLVSCLASSHYLNQCLSSIWHLGTNFRDIWIKIQQFSLMKINMLIAKDKKTKMKCNSHSVYCRYLNHRTSVPMLILYDYSFTISSSVVIRTS